MKQKFFIGFLILEAVVFMILCILQASMASVLFTAIAFPFEQIGIALRTLSLSSGLGNIIAILIYILVSLLPAIVLYILNKKRRLYMEDWLLLLLSIMLFVVLYIMINPGIIGLRMGELIEQPFGKAILSSMIYQVLLGYFILRILKMFTAGGTDKLIRYMSVMLSILNVIFIFLAFGACFDDLFSSIAALKASNTNNENLLGASYICLVIQFIVDALPFVLDVVVVFAALNLLDEMQKDRYSIETVIKAKHMSKLCVVTLTAALLSNIGFILLKLIFAKSLMIFNSSINIPIFSIIFILAVLLLTRFITENKQLKDDNDMFI